MIKAVCLMVGLTFLTLPEPVPQDTFSGTYQLQNSTDRLVLQDNQNGTVSGTIFTKVKAGNQDIRIRVTGTYMLTRAKGQNDWLITICGKGGTQSADMVICFAGYSDGPQKNKIFTSIARAQTTDMNGGKEESATEHQVWVKK